jgi:hypothetical protein
VAQVGRQPLQLALLDEPARLREPRDRRVERGTDDAHARDRLTREVAQRRQRGVQLAERRVALAERVAERRHGRLERTSSLAIAPAVVLRSVTSSFESRGFDASAANVRCCRAAALDVAVRLHAEQRVVREGAVAVGGLERRDGAG